jgi:Domain of unknown function (DUF4398)
MREISRAHPGVRLCVAAGLTGALLLVAACASAPLAPNASLDAAKVAITNAEKVDASHYAGAELGEARHKLDLADNAVTKEDMVAAEQLADQARVEAELATARTGAAKAVAVNEELSRGADALTEEMQRAGEQQ